MADHIPIKRVRREIHVIPARPRGWRLRLEGLGVLAPVFATKLAARRAGRAVAEAVQPSELVPHRRDGRIEKHGRETFPRSSDPESSRG